MPVIESEYFMWSLLIMEFCAISALHIWLGRQLAKKIKMKNDAKLSKEVSSFQRLNSIKFFLITSVLFAIVAGYDLQIRKLSKQFEELEDVISINEKTAAEIKPAANDIVEEKTYYPPLMERNDAVDDTLEPAPVELKPQTTIQDIFGDDHSKKSVNDIKGRYEELLATHFLMSKCGKAGTGDYSIIVASLQKEINAIDGPARLQYDTLMAAKGSYEELYSRNDCTKPDLKITEDQYNSYIQTLSKSLQR